MARREVRRCEGSVHLRGTADKTITPESRGVEAILDGLRHLHYPDDQKQREASWPVLDALYAYCRQKVEVKSADASDERELEERREQYH